MLAITSKAKSSYGLSHIKSLSNEVFEGNNITDKKLVETAYKVSACIRNGLLDEDFDDQIENFLSDCKDQNSNDNNFVFLIAQYLKAEKVFQEKRNSGQQDESKKKDKLDIVITKFENLVDNSKDNGQLTKLLLYGSSKIFERFNELQRRNLFDDEQASISDALLEFHKADFKDSQKTDLFKEIFFHPISLFYDNFDLNFKATEDFFVSKLKLFAGEISLADENAKEDFIKSIHNFFQDKYDNLKSDQSQDDAYLKFGIMFRVKHLLSAFESKPGFAEFIQDIQNKFKEKFLFSPDDEFLFLNQKNIVKLALQHSDQKIFDKEIESLKIDKELYLNQLKISLETQNELVKLRDVRNCGLSRIAELEAQNRLKQGQIEEREQQMQEMQMQMQERLRQVQAMQMEADKRREQQMQESEQQMKERERQMEERQRQMQRQIEEREQQMKERERQMEESEQQMKERERQMEEREEEMHLQLQKNNMRIKEMDDQMKIMQEQMQGKLPTEDTFSKGDNGLDTDLKSNQTNSYWSILPSFASYFPGIPSPSNIFRSESSKSPQPLKKGGFSEEVV